MYAIFFNDNLQVYAHRELAYMEIIEMRRMLRKENMRNFHVARYICVANRTTKQ